VRYYLFVGVRLLVDGCWCTVVDGRLGGGIRLVSYCFFLVTVIRKLFRISEFYLLYMYRLIVSFSVFSLYMPFFC
jgi:hypothetical protein